MSVLVENYVATTTSAISYDFYPMTEGPIEEKESLEAPTTEITYLANSIPATSYIITTSKRMFNHDMNNSLTSVYRTATSVNKKAATTKKSAKTSASLKIATVSSSNSLSSAFSIFIMNIFLLTNHAINRFQL
jgi:hypothetical protein